MADVYRGRVIGIRGFTRTIAIKRIHPHLLERERFMRMFTDEAKIGIFLGSAIAGVVGYLVMRRATAARAEQDATAEVPSA